MRIHTLYYFFCLRMSPERLFADWYEISKQKDRTGDRKKTGWGKKRHRKIPYVFPVFYISFLLGLARMTG